MITRERRVWSSTVTETLQLCFDDTDWNVFTDSAGSLEEMVDGVSEYTLIVLSKRSLTGVSAII